MAQSPSAVTGTVNDLFDQFTSASTLKGVVTTFRRICHLLDLKPGPFSEFYPAFKKGLAGSHKQTKNWKAQSIFGKIDRKASNRIYHQSTGSSSSGTRAGQHPTLQTQVSQSGSHNNILEEQSCLVVGGGPCGLRTAIELQLLGAPHVLVIEKRDRYSRNNVLHLWPFVIADLKQMAGKKFYGKFCAGSIDHVSIRQLQLMLLKFALILGVDYIENVTFDGICPHNLVSSLSGRTVNGDTNGVNGCNHVSNGSQNGVRGSCCGKRKTRFQSGLTTSREDEEENLSNSSPCDRADGNVCGRLRSHPSPDMSAEQVARSAASSTSSAVRVKDGESECENENLDDNERNAGTRVQSAGSSILQNSSTGINDRAPVSSSRSNCDRRNGQAHTCGCCCHLHSAGAGYWDTDAEMAEYQTPGAFAHFSVTSANPATASAFTDYDSILRRLHGFQFNVILGADGRRNTLAEHFPRKEFRGRLAIAITANFVNTHTLTEAQIPEISGISFIYNQQLFRNLYEDTGIDLENICYYKDDTHYFVMTAKKSSLLARKVLYNDFPDTKALLDPENINRTELLNYAKDAAKWTTGLEQSFAMNHYGEPDIAMFDFTSMYAAENACRAKKIVTWNWCQSCACADPTSKKMRKTGSQESGVNALPAGGRAGAEVRESLLLVGLVGDSLLEPFWPTGSGCGRGFLSAMDSAWMVRQWAAKDCTTDQEAALAVLKEREAIYRLLGQTKSENLSQNYAAYTLNPISRYPNLNSSTVFPHECRHLLYDDIEPPAAPVAAEMARKRRQMIAAKRARRATIASSSPFSTMSEEKMAVVGIRDSVPLPTPVSQDFNSLEQSLEDSFADFETNYQGLIEKSSASNSSSHPTTSNQTPQTSSSTLVNSGASGSRSSAFNEMMLSPSASNLATLGRSRAKDIEAALRHRRQQQLSYNRSDSSYRSSSSNCNEESSDTPSHSNPKETSQQLKNKMSWLLESKDSSSTPSITSSSRDVEVGKETAAPFASRVRNLEAKFHANSGLHASDSSAYEECDQKKRIMSKGSNVMTAATTLEQLLNPSQQEVRLKEKASDYRKKTHDIKVVMRMTKETDWNKKCWEEREKQAAAEKQRKPAVSPTPRPKKMIDIFRGKKDEIKNKLHDDDPNQAQIRLTSTKKPKARKNDDNGWISLIKTELTERSISPNRLINKTVAKAPLRSPFLQDASATDDKKMKFQFIHNQRKKSDARDSSPSGVTLEQKRTSPASGRCVRCSQQVATVDRILISGVLLHRACLTCSRCGITLRLSEVRDGAGDDVCNFNYLCILCSKNRANNVTRSDRMSTSMDGSLLVARPPPAPVSPNQQRKAAAAPTVDKPAIPSFAATDEYEFRLRERMKWKEQFLLNNNNIDFGPLVKRHVFKTSSVGTSDGSHMTDESKSCSHNEKAVVDQTDSAAEIQTTIYSTDSPSVPESVETTASPTDSQKINERIEYENVSQSFELYDDDELTKMLNLESTDQWESGEESSSSGSWRRSDDSTDADFDSDEFDLSHASKQAERRRQEAKKRRQEAEQEALVVPEIVVQATDEEATATSQEIDTRILDSTGGLSLEAQESTLDQVSVTDSLDAEHVGSGLLLASASLRTEEISAHNTCCNSDSDSGESRTLAHELGISRKAAAVLTTSPDLSSKEGQEEEDTLDTSVSSLSCCDVSGTFQDLNLLSLVDEERTAGASTAALMRKGLASGSTASPLLTSNTLTSGTSTTSPVQVTASASPTAFPPTTSTTNSRHSPSNHSNTGSPVPSSSCTLVPSLASTPASGRSRLLTSTSSDLTSHADKLTSGLSGSNTCASFCNSSPSSNLSSNGTKAATSFKVAQPKFTVFNFDFKLPASGNSSSLTLRTRPSLTQSSNPESSIKSQPFCSPASRSSASGGLSSEVSATSTPADVRAGPPTHQDHEKYSRIPVLATRVNESNGKGKAPSYSGSFTEKLMLRCRSSPTLHGKENLLTGDSSGAGGGAGGSGAGYQSVLAKWACNNLFQMERASSPATYSVMDLLSRARSNDTSSGNTSLNPADPDSRMS